MAEIVPDTESVSVAALAVAWSIVKSVSASSLPGGGQENIKYLTNEVLKVYIALLSQKPMP